MTTKFQNHNRFKFQGSVIMTEDTRTRNLRILSDRFLKLCVDEQFWRQHIIVENYPINCASFWSVCHLLNVNNVNCKNLINR